MPSFRFYGVHADTGEEVKATIRADSQEEAEAIASVRKIMVSRVRVLDESPGEVVPTSSIAPPAPHYAAPRVEAGHGHKAYTINVNTPKRASSFGIAGFIVAIIALLVCWIPLIGVVGVPLAVLALGLAGIGLIVALVRRGSGVGWPIAGGVVGLLALAISGFQSAVLVGGVGAVGATVSSMAEENQRLTKEWEPPAGMAKGDIGVTIAVAEVGKVPMRDAMQGNVTSDNELLMLTLAIANNSRNRKLDVRDMQGAFMNTPTLVDDVGNKYRGVDFSFNSVVNGSRSETILPGESASFVLVFEAPIPQASTLILTVPASNFGGRGNVILETPAP